VRSAELNLSGAITARMTAPEDASTTLTGNCSPDMWANFGIQFNHPGYVWIAVTIMTKDPIQTGQTGPIRLEWVDVSFFSEDMKSLQFRGPGSFEIKEHNAAPDNRRMAGVIQAKVLKAGRMQKEKPLTQSLTLMSIFPAESSSRFLRSRPNPTIRDRVAQMATKLVIEPIFEADFCETSYGFKPKRSAHDAVDDVARTMITGYSEIIDADLSKYFDTIPHAKLMAVVAERISDGAILHLIRMCLKAPVMEVDRNGRKRNVGGGKGNRKGTPQGGESFAAPGQPLPAPPG
jgi:hypothetical protein